MPDGISSQRRATACLALMLLAANCHRPHDDGATADAGAADTTASEERSGLVARIARALGIAAADSEWPPYTGHGPNNIPHYARRTFSPTERLLLRQTYGIEEPQRLYISDSTEDGLLKYDTQEKRCSTCYVNSYRVGLVSVRRDGESWEQLERRIRAMRPRDFSSAAHIGSASTADLDPDIRADAEQMLADARRQGFVLSVKATYRSPEREAYLMAEGRGRTHTLTSLHSYGRALDIVVGDGRLVHAATRANWIAFRRWVTSYRGDEFRILGTPDSTWDWPHVELPSPMIGFRSIEDALARARTCRPAGAPAPPCDFSPHLPPRLAGAAIQSDSSDRAYRAGKEKMRARARSRRLRVRDGPR